MNSENTFFKLNKIKKNYYFETDRSFRIIVSPEIIAESPLGLVSYEYGPGQTGPAHTHDTEVEVYFVLKGSGKVRIGNKVFPLEPGNVVYISPQTEHQTKSCADDSLEFLAFFVPSIKF